MMSSKYRVSLFSTAALLAGQSLFLTPAFAQNDAASANGAVLEEITVTAERRADNLQRVPVAVTNFSTVQLQQENIQSLRSLGMEATSLFIPRSNINPSTNSYFIRGVGESDAVQAGGVGIYIDDVFLPRGLGSNYEFGDTESVEVLRGPQGTLYGRNSEAGAIKITTKQPRDTFGFYSDNQVGNYGQFIERAGINIPIAPGIAGSIDYVHHQRDGTIFNAYTRNDTRDIDSDALQAKLRFDLDDALSVTVTARGLLDNSTGGSAGSSIYVPGGVLQSLGLVKGPIPPRISYSEYANNYNHMQQAALAANATWQIDDNHTLKSITSYYEMEQPGQYDTDLSPKVLSELLLHHRDHLVTQEFQFAGNFDSWRYTTGLYYYHETFNSYRVTSTQPAAVVQVVPQWGTERIDSLAAYGQGTYKVTDALSLTAGARFTFEHRSFDFTYGTLAPVRALGEVTAQHSWDSFTPKVGIDYQITPDILAYVSFSQGFKAGGYDNRANSLLAATKPFEQEKVDAWEIGLKSELFDKRLRVNLAAFNNAYSNFQTTARDIPTGTTLRVNAGDAETRGFEVETTAVVTEDLTWINNASFLTATVTKTKSLLSDGTNPLGHRLPYAPRWTLSSRLQYDLPIHPFGLGGTWASSVNVNYTTTTYIDLQNSQVGKAPPQVNLNLDLYYTSEDGHWLTGISVQNAANSVYGQGGTTSGTGAKAYTTTNFNEPRLVEFRVKYTY
jgi:iron complex outermembrane receptor protein